MLLHRVSHLKPHAFGYTFSLRQAADCAEATTTLISYSILGEIQIMSTPTRRAVNTLAAIAGISLYTLAQAATTSIDVYRDPNCGCCTKWISYLKDNGYEVVDHLENNMSAVKEKLGVPAQLGSCHTGVVNGKFVEGHVPVEQIAELSTRPDLKGVAAPGMPLGSPGMESGTRRSAHQIIGVTNSGDQTILADVPAR